MTGSESLFPGAGRFKIKVYMSKDVFTATNTIELLLDIF